MKAGASGINADINDIATTTCYLCRITRQDNAVRRLSNHDVPYTIDLGSGNETFYPGGGFIRSQLTQEDEYKIGNMEIEGPTIELDSESLDPDDLRDGIYDNAKFDAYEVNWMDNTRGSIYHMAGWFGKVSYTEGKYKVELRDLSQRLENIITRRAYTYCDTKRVKFLGDTHCKIVLDPPIWQASTAYAVDDVIKGSTFDGRKYRCTTAGTSDVSEPTFDTTIGNTTTDGTVVWTAEQAFIWQAKVLTVTSKLEFTVEAYDGSSPAPDFADDYLNFGLATWITGDNALRVIEIKDWILSTATVKLFLPTPKDIQIGDTLYLQVGCDRNATTCRDKFNNLINHGGFRFIPTRDTVISTPNAKQ